VRHDGVTFPRKKILSLHRFCNGSISHTTGGGQASRFEEDEIKIPALFREAGINTNNPREVAPLRLQSKIKSDPDTKRRDEHEKRQDEPDPDQTAIGMTTNIVSRQIRSRHNTSG